MGMKTTERIRTITVRESAHRRLHEHLSKCDLAPKIADAVSAAINEWVERRESRA